MKWMTTAKFESGLDQPMRLADSIEEARELAADWLSHLDPDRDALPEQIHFWRELCGRYVWKFSADPEELA
jgi:hypothetical protein